MPRPNRPPPVQQVPLVRCVRCQITLRLPLNAPVFQCPQCSQRLRAPPAVVEVANREKAMQALVTAGAALRDGASWACEICTHVNTLSVEACIMCSTSRQDARKVLMAQEAGGDEADGEIAVADFADGALEQGHIEVKTSAAREQAGRLQRMGEASRRRGASDATGPAALRQSLALVAGSAARRPSVQVTWALPVGAGGAARSLALDGSSSDGGTPSVRRAASYRLFIVTFYANLAHSLTRSP
jgi:hypothetical protein